MCVFHYFLFVFVNINKQNKKNNMKNKCSIPRNSEERA